MISASQPEPIDLNLVDQVFDRIPDGTWTFVRDAIVANIVDNMPSEIVNQLTNKPDDFDRAEEIILDYYRPDDRRKELIADGFKILGTENTLYLLDSLQLDKYIESLKVKPKDTAPCSIDPE